MFISIIIPTYSRPDVLRGTLDSFKNLNFENLPPCELLVVNNSPQVAVSSLLDFNIPGITIREFEEPKTGLSQARNCGIRHSKGTWVAFVDDDVSFHPDWLKAIVQGIAAHPECDFFGGRILVSPSANLPDWSIVQDGVDSWLHGITGNYDFGTSDLQYDPQIMAEFFGANLIVKKSLVEKIGGFNTKLGLSGNNQHIAGEDTEIVRRMHNNQAQGYYLGAALVWHKAPSICLESHSIDTYF